ncbi:MULTISPECIES: hypothetical protein [unclassified Anabaena]|uniref:hypothetical protein n=1 Tax=unclassified Anabaena TaxID=2619674 RepID=UPI000831D882
MAIFLIVVAIFGKVITGFSVFGQSQINRLATGVGIILKGEVELVFSGVPATSDVLSKLIGVAMIDHGYSHNLISPSPAKFLLSCKITQHGKRFKATHSRGVGNRQPQASH